MIFVIWGSATCYVLSVQISGSITNLVLLPNQPFLSQESFLEIISSIKCIYYSQGSSKRLVRKSKYNTANVQTVVWFADATTGRSVISGLG